MHILKKIIHNGPILMKLYQPVLGGPVFFETQYRYSIMAAHTMEPDKLGKVRPTTHLQFAAATNRFY